MSTGSSPAQYKVSTVSVQCSGNVDVVNRFCFIDLGRIIADGGAIANVVGMTQMDPPIMDLCESQPILLFVQMC